MDDLAKSRFLSVRLYLYYPTISHHRDLMSDKNGPSDV